LGSIPNGVTSGYASEVLGSEIFYQMSPSKSE
jgi:hypothetical protein